MPILIAVAVATVVVTVVLALVAVRGRRTDPADVRTGADGLVDQAHRHPMLRRFILDRRDTTKATGWLLTVALGVITGLTLAVGLLLEMVQTHAGFARWDDAAARWGAAHTTGATEWVVRVITLLGGTPVVIALCLGVSIVEYRRLPTWAVPAFMATVVVSQLVVTNLIKVAVGRERPNVARLVEASGFSFPSGHTAASAAVYAAIALVVGRRRNRRIGFDDAHLFVARKPERFFLPKPHVSTAYVFTLEDYFFAYPNNYNYYVNHYRNTFQHGGVSLEEMVIPFAYLKAK